MDSERAETIVALATPTGKGALAVIRISGPGAFCVFGACVDKREVFENLPDRTIQLFRVRNVRENAWIDQVTAVKYTAPRSYTGENMVEVICHGGVVTPPEVLRMIMEAGTRSAEPGEFTRRAVLNDKMNLLEAEAVHAIVESVTHEEQRRALRSLSGEQSDSIGRIVAQLRELSAALEAAVEFGVDGGLDVEAARGQLRQICGFISDGLSSWEQMMQGREMVRIVLAGKPNAGKSTLFNLLVGEERAIVDSMAGTTRDYLIERVGWGERAVHLIDTAGLGESDDSVGTRGIERSWEQVARAQRIIWVCPLDSEDLSSDEERLLEQCKGKQVLAVLSKTDRAVSTKRRERVARMGIASVETNLLDIGNRNALREFVLGQRGGEPKDDTDVLVVSIRQREILANALATGQMLCDDGNAREDAFADGLRRMLEEFGLLVGVDGSVLDDVFAKFCVGK